MAFQVGTTCYSTALEAAQSVASAQVGSIVSQAGTAFSVSVQAVADDSISYVLSPLTGGSSFLHVAPFTGQPCNLLQVSDGLQMGWLVAGAWIAAYCVMFIARALRGETDGNYGNS